jgi:hypothetical protein
MSVCVALVIQHPVRMQPITLSSVAFLAHHIFPGYLINGKIFGKKLLNMKCVFRISLRLLTEPFSILWIIQRDITMNVKRHVEYPLFLLDFNKTWTFSTNFRKTQISNFMKIRPVGDELLPADERTRSYGSGAGQVPFLRVHTCLQYSSGTHKRHSTLHTAAAVDDCDNDNDNDRESTTNTCENKRKPGQRGRPDYSL